MGTFADSLFSMLMSWVRALVTSLWALFTSERTTALEFLGKNWLMIALVLIAAGLFIDWIIWLIRWKPYTLWAQRARKLLRIAPDDEDAPQEVAMASAIADAAAQAPVEAMDPDSGVYQMEDEQEDWLPERPAFDEADTQEAQARADAVPDEELGVYPGMRYDEQVDLEKEEMGSTRRFGAVHQEGPGAAEVNRRREEIDAYKRELEEEARRERERRMEEMRKAEEERLAQEEYMRQMAEYEKQKAQYERELAQYQRDLQAYEEAMAARREEAEAAQEIAPQINVGRTRVRRRKATYSDMIDGESVEELPQTPQWPQMDQVVSEVSRSAEPKRQEKKNGFAQRMAHLIEPENEEFSGMNALPPRVDPKQAYKPAAKPEDEKKRRRK